MNIDSSFCPSSEFLAAYTEGAATADEQAAFAGHLDQCVECRRTISELARVASSHAASEQSAETPVAEQASRFSFAAGEALGRFVILRELGQGGGGRVALAYDPQLARNVALKIVHRHRGKGADEMISEARALAGLSHPHVVSVYEVIEWKGETVLAMEYVEGPSLAEWMLLHSKESWKNKLELLLQAGEGLRAAHRLGIVHRDVKPANIICAPQRAVLADFGLASTLEGQPAVTPAIVGTPGYIAPEVLAGQSSDVRSDQYSFCVTAVEILAGRRPAVGEPVPRSVPRRLRQALSQGLVQDPALRHTSMDELLESLRAAARRRGYGIGASLLTAGLAGWLAWSTVGLELKCRSETRHAASLWPAMTRDSVGQRLATQGGEGSATRVLDSVSHFITEWTETAQSACQERGLRRIASSPVFSARAQCLEQRLGELDGLVTALVTGEIGSRDSALTAALALPSSKECLSRSRPTAYEPPDPSRAETKSAYQKLGQLQALMKAGRADKAKESAHTLVTTAQKLGLGYVSRHASAIEALALRETGDMKGSEAQWMTVAKMAAESGEEPLMIEAWLELGLLETRYLNHIPEAKVWTQVAQMGLLRSPQEARLHAKLERTLGDVAEFSGDYKRAIEHVKEAVAINERAYGAMHPLLIKDLGVLSLMMETQDSKSANAPLERATRIAEAAYGQSHTEVAGLLLIAGKLEKRRFRFAEAKTFLYRALQMLDDIGGTPPPFKPDLLDSLATVELRLDEKKKARALYEQAIQLGTQIFGADHIHVASTIASMASLDFFNDDYKAAEAGYRRALELEERVLGREHLTLAPTLSNLGRILTDQNGRCSEGIEFVERAKSIYERVNRSHPKISFCLWTIAKCQRILGRPHEALQSLQQAETIAGQTLPSMIPHIQFEQAQSLWKLGKPAERRRARALLQAAESDFKANKMSSNLDEVRAWRKARGI